MYTDKDLSHCGGCAPTPLFLLLSVYHYFDLVIGLGVMTLRPWVPPLLG